MPSTALVIFIAALSSCAVYCKPTVSRGNDGNGNSGYKYDVSHYPGNSRMHMNIGGAYQQPYQLHQGTKIQDERGFISNSPVPSEYRPNHYERGIYAHNGDSPYVEEVIHEPQPQYHSPYDSVSKPLRSDNNIYNGNDESYLDNTDYASSGPSSAHGPYFPNEQEAGFNYPNRAPSHPQEYTKPPLSQEHINPHISQENIKPHISQEHINPHISQGHNIQPISQEYINAPISEGENPHLSQKYNNPPVSQEYIHPSVSQEYNNPPVSQEYINPPVSQEYTSVKSPKVSQEHVGVKGPLVSQKYIDPTVSQEYISPPIAQEYITPLSQEYVEPLVSQKHVGVKGPQVSQEYIKPPVSQEYVEPPVSQEHVGVKGQKVSQEHVGVKGPQVSQKYINPLVSQEYINPPIAQEYVTPVSQEYVEPPVSQEHVVPHIEQGLIIEPVLEQHIKSPIAQEPIHTPISQKNINPKISQEYVNNPHVQQQQIRQSIKQAYPQPSNPEPLEQVSIPVYDAPIEASDTVHAGPKYQFIPSGPPYVTNSHTTEIIHPPLQGGPTKELVEVAEPYVNVSPLVEEAKPASISHAFRLPIAAIAHAPSGPHAAQISPENHNVHADINTSIEPISHSTRLLIPGSSATSDSNVADILPKSQLDLESPGSFQNLAGHLSPPVSHSIRLPIPGSAPSDAAILPKSQLDLQSPGRFQEIAGELPPFAPFPQGTDHSPANEAPIHPPISHAFRLNLPGIDPHRAPTSEGNSFDSNVPSVASLGLVGSSSREASHTPRISHAFRLNLPSSIPQESAPNRPQYFNEEAKLSDPGLLALESKSI